MPRREYEGWGFDCVDEFHRYHPYLSKNEEKELKHERILAKSARSDMKMMEHYYHAVSILHEAWCRERIKEGAKKCRFYYPGEEPEEGLEADWSDLGMSEATFEDDD